ncbi:Uncharacterized protein ESCO_002222 [Escovopsis weberi]|uniref:Potassium channel tetramerisation-type BTB domain-containing protein n=1 Tax=Escovopsis weberi TaxID=150374 RepID=A0A0M9VWI9_ESCWE|nr:Uncharacterized protein ESCO_002222 [Escovopsis weberi]
MASASPSSSAYGSTFNLPRQTEKTIVRIPQILPRERVFPIQIGGELFKLSGASISSDAPSYFSQYFLCQIKDAESRGEDVGSAIRTLYIDRDPVTFRDIALHLQGYHIQPRDGTHFVRLFADAQFYNLPKLISQLYQESIFISIGHREFQIPRELLNDPANSPNYFSLGFAMFFSQPEDLFPGLDREGLLRPPSILPPSVPNKSANTFTDLLRLLQGYPVDIRDETHRQELLRDARYFHFKGLEQRLIPHSISYNPVRRRTEIALRLENVQKSGISIAPGRQGSVASPPRPCHRYVNYARPSVDDQPAEMILEIGGSATKIHFTADGPRAEFFLDTKARIARLMEVVATKLEMTPSTQSPGLFMPTAAAAAAAEAEAQPIELGDTPQSDDFVRVAFEDESSVFLDGEDYDSPLDAAPTTTSEASNPRKKRRIDDTGDSDADTGPETRTAPREWVVKTGQWRLRIQGAQPEKSLQCVLVAVKLDAVSSGQGRNKARPFLVG